MSDSPFFDWLERRARAIDSLLCVGLDPRVETADALLAECRRLIEATAPYACAFKLNSAFFERIGAAGLNVLCRVIRTVPADIPVILDGKRGDIADTALAYAEAAFDLCGAHAVTLNPYLGGEALAPFLERPERGAFILCKTSNRGADEFQALDVGGRLLYEAVAQRAQTWSRYPNVGLVVGATDPVALARVRMAAPDAWLLVPGVGAQGGDLETTLEAGLRPDGLGVLVNVSRAIAQAFDPAVAAQQLRDTMRAVATRVRQRAVESYTTRIRRYVLRQLAQDLIASQCVRFGSFVLKSGITSPIYLDLRRLAAHPVILRRVAQAYVTILRDLTFDRLAGVPYAALPIATAVALEMNMPFVYPRRETKDYGTQAVVEGEYRAGERVVLLDDIATTGDSKLEAIHKLESVGLQVRDIVVLIDRGQGAATALAQAHYRLHAVVTLPELLEEWLRSGAINRARYEEVKAFLAR
ncbi:MAG: orotidine-5'-phosphate decarboxylase [Anaerolineae bacterium]|nr:orotidine-5'-phosphate decarboxylase [Anaerolineae bacterium]MDW8070412.1 orotidine-5'-phosphate decarboxylase [Anaerolineae bacterium]